MSTVNELLNFIDKSPSCYHVVDNLESMLKACGFRKLLEEEIWGELYEGKYFVTRGGSSIIAFGIGKQDFKNFQIAASHSDSPVFKIKENPELMADKNYVELNVEKYGGMLLAPWFDRPLSVAGRVLIREDNEIKTKIINVDRDLCMLPSLAIHMNREANDGYKYNARKDMVPIFGAAESKGSFLEIVAKAAEVDKEGIIASDLFLYNRVKPSVWGACEEFFSSAKIDDLECVYTTFKAFLSAVVDAVNDDSVQVFAVFDNEEVGSTTKQGADSTFLSDILFRIGESCEKTAEEIRIALAKSMMLSADNAHAVHPNYIEKADSINRPYMNKGVVIKYAANQKYTTDAVSAAVFKEILDRAGVPFQTFTNASDIPGGSTLGNIANSHVSMSTVDIGLAQLAMHSPYETAGVKDADMMVSAVREFYNTFVDRNGDRICLISKKN